MTGCRICPFSTKYLAADLNDPNALADYYCTERLTADLTDRSCYAVMLLSIPSPAQTYCRSLLHLNVPCPAPCRSS